MKAYRFHHWKQPGQLEEIPVPEPGPGEALIRIGAAGACHSDLHLMHEWSPAAIPQLAGWSLPFTLGHENAGWIEGVQRVRDATGGLGAMAVLDFVGIDATLAMAAQSLRHMGGSCWWASGVVNCPSRTARCPGVAR